MSDLGQRLADARRVKRLTQQWVADQLGVSTQAVSQWENGKTIPETRNLIKLSALLGIDLQGDDGLGDVLIDWGTVRAAASTAPLVKWTTPTHWLDVNSLTTEEWWNIKNEPIDTPIEMLVVKWKPKGKIFALTIKDRALHPIFLDGDEVIVDTGAKPTPSSYAVIVLPQHNEVILRRLRELSRDEEGGALYDLMPISEDYAPIRIINGVSGNIIGIVREHRRYFDVFDRM